MPACGQAAAHPLTLLPSRRRPPPHPSDTTITSMSITSSRGVRLVQFRRAPRLLHIPARHCQ
eukprot:2820903-Rhodomonas_salina.1